MVQASILYPTKSGSAALFILYPHELLTSIKEVELVYV